MVAFGISLKEGRGRKGGDLMPKAFVQCVKAGGRVRTKKLKGNKYMRICFKGGKSYAGEVKTKKKKK